MSWNLHLSIVRGRTLDDLRTLGFGVAGDPLTAEQATHLPAPAVAQAEDNLLFIDGAIVAPEFNVVLASRLETEVVTGLFSGVSDTYVWSVLRTPEEHRTWAVTGGETVQDDGTPLPEERDVTVLDEDALFGLIDARTGLGAWLDVPAYALAMSSPPPRRRWFRRG